MSKTTSILPKESCPLNKSCTDNLRDFTNNPLGHMMRLPHNKLPYGAFSYWGSYILYSYLTIFYSEQDKKKEMKQFYPLML